MSLPAPAASPASSNTPVQASQQNIQSKNNAPQSPVTRTSTVLVRKKLPWLDGPRIPGQFDSKETLGFGSRDEHSAPNASKVAESASRRTSAPLLVEHDPAFRFVGSTPSLRERHRPGDLRSLSVTSQLRPGSKPMTSRRYPDAAFDLGKPASKATQQSSSAYSVADEEETSRTLPRIDSYERLIERHSSPYASRRHKPLGGASQFLGDELDVSPEQPVSPRQQVRVPRRRTRRQISPRQRERSSSDSDGQHEATLRPPPTLRTMPRAKTLPQRSVAIPPPEPPMPPPSVQPTPPSRKTTLFAMPTHLLLSSSSSSQSPLHTSPPQLPALPDQPPPPLPPPPVRQSREVRQPSQSLNRAVTGLENLMHEALNVARDAAQSGRNDEVASVLDSATIALRRASTGQGQMNTGRMSQPLVLSPAVSDHNVSDSESSVGPDSDASSAGHSVDTVPTVLTRSTRSSRPVLVDPESSRRKSFKASFETLDDRLPDRHSIGHTPPRLYQPPSAESVVRDFAYARAQTARAEAARQLSRSHGAAEAYYCDTGQSVAAQPGVRPSLSAPMMIDEPIKARSPTQRPSVSAASQMIPASRPKQQSTGRSLHPATTQSIPPRTSSRN